MLSITGIADMRPQGKVTLQITRDDTSETITLISRIDTQNELSYYRHGGILAFILRKLNSDALSA